MKHTTVFLLPVFLALKISVNALASKLSCCGPNPWFSLLPEMVVAPLGISPFWPVSKMRPVRALR